MEGVFQGGMAGSAVEPGGDAEEHGIEDMAFRTYHRRDVRTHRKIGARYEDVYCDAFERELQRMGHHGGAEPLYGNGQGRWHHRPDVERHDPLAVPFQRRQRAG